MQPDLAELSAFDHAFPEILGVRQETTLSTAVVQTLTRYRPTAQTYWPVTGVTLVDRRQRASLSR